MSAGWLINARVLKRDRALIGKIRGQNIVTVEEQGAKRLAFQTRRHQQNMSD